MELNFSDPEYEQLQRQAAEVGLSVQELVEQLVRRQLERRYRLPRKPGRVVPFQGLNSSKPGSEP